MFWCSTLAYNYLPVIRVIKQKSFAVQMNACTGKNGTVTRQKDNESDEVSWGEFLWLVLIGEYNVPYWYEPVCHTSASLTVGKACRHFSLSTTFS